MDQIHAPNSSTAADAAQAASHRDRAISLAFAGGVLAKCFAGFVTLITVPMAIDALGPETYGLWIAITAFFTMFRFLDGGVVYAMVNITATCNANDDFERLRRLLSTSYWISIAISVLGFAVTVPLVFMIDWNWLLGIGNAIEVDLLRKVVLLAAGLFFVSFPLGIAGKVLQGLQRMHWISGIGIIANAIMLAAVIVGWWFRLDLLWFLIAFASGPILANLLITIVLWMDRPDLLPPRISDLTTEPISELIRLGFLFWGLQVSMSLAFEIDAVLVSHFVGLRGAAELGVVNQMYLVATTFTALLAAPLWPAFRDAAVRGDREWIQRTLLRTVKISLGLSLCLTIPILIFGGWAGELLAARKLVPTFAVLVAVFVWTNLQAVGGVLAMLMNGLQVIRLQLVLSFLMTVVNLVLSLLLVQWIGVSGVIWGSIIAYIGCILIPYWMLLPRIIDKHMGEKPRGD